MPRKESMEGGCLGQVQYKLQLGNCCAELVRVTTTFWTEDVVRRFAIRTFTYQVLQTIVRTPHQFVIFGRNREVWKK